MIMTAINIILIYAKDPNVSENYSKICLKQPLKRQKLVFKSDYCISMSKVLQNAPFCNTFDLHLATICH